MRRERVPEKAEQAHIVQLLRSIGAAVYAIGTHRRRGDYQGTMQSPGIPDLMAFLPAWDRARPSRRIFLFIECKARGGRLRAEQQVFRDQCLDADVCHIVGGLDDVIAWLTERGYVNANQFPHYRQPNATQERV